MPFLMTLLLLLLLLCRQLITPGRRLVRKYEGRVLLSVYAKEAPRVCMIVYLLCSFLSSNILCIGGINFTYHFTHSPRAVYYSTFQ